MQEWKEEHIVHSQISKSTKGMTLKAIWAWNQTLKNKLSSILLQIKQSKDTQCKFKSHVNNKTKLQWRNVFGTNNQSHRSNFRTWLKVLKKDSRSRKIHELNQDKDLFQCYSHSIICRQIALLINLLHHPSLKSLRINLRFHLKVLTRGYFVSLVK